MRASSTSGQPAITFNPGPSQLSQKMVNAIQEIAESGFLSNSHRGAAFMEVSKRAIEGLRDRMRIPADYRIFYQPSATAAMDTLLRNLVFKKSFHFVHGAFASLFYKTSLEIGLEADLFDSPWERAVSWNKVSIPGDCELIAVTHNETSTGLMWPLEEIQRLRENYPSFLLAIDATSSFGALKMRWEDADVWFGSVQKCLGLPAGLGFLIVNPRAYEKGLKVITEKEGIPRWHRFDYMAEKMQNYQTPETPNMLAIALLAKQMEDWDIDEIESEHKKKAQLIYEAQLPWKPYVIDPTWRSSTVMNFLVDNPSQWHEKAGRAGMVLGKGYGPLKEKSIRISNFPAISLGDVQKLLDSLR